MVMQDVISSLQRLLEILSQRKDICKYAIVESVLVIPSKFTYSMIKPAFGSCYGLIKYNESWCQIQTWYYLFSYCNIIKYNHIDFYSLG